MTVNVTMTATRMGEDGTLWESGTTHAATEHFARHLVQFQWATATFYDRTAATTARARVTSAGEFEFLDHTGDVIAGATTLAAIIAEYEDRSLFPGHGLRTMLFGHSYIDQESAGVSELSQNLWRTVGTIAWANSLIDKTLQIVYELGRGSWLIDDMLAQYDVYAPAVRPQVLIVSLGHNDLKNLYADTGTQQPEDPEKQSLARAIGKMRNWLLTKVSGSTQVFFLGETPPGKDPAGSVSASNTSHLGARFLAWNKFLRGLAQEFNNVHYVPVEQVTLNPTATAIINRDGHYWDQTHPGLVGAYLRGKMLATYLSRVLPIHCSPLAFLHAENWVLGKITTTRTKPSFDGDYGYFDLGAAGNVTGDYRKIYKGEWVGIRFAGATDKFYNGRYYVTDATADGFTVLAPGRTPIAETTNHADCSTLSQYFRNPVLLTKTGGQVNAAGVVGTLTLTDSPLGVTINSVPTGWTVVADCTTAHTQRDGAAGFGNWITLTVTAPATAGAFEVRFQVSYNNTVQGADIENLIGVNATAIQAGCEALIVDPQATLSAVECQMVFITFDGAGINSTTYRAIDGYRDTTMTPATAAHPFPTGEDIRITLLTPETVVTEDVATRRCQTAYMSVFVRSSGAMTSQVIRIGRPSFLVVDHPIERAAISFN